MRLYVTNPNSQKVYLNLNAPTRNELQGLVGGPRFMIGNAMYSVSNVYAEADASNTAAGAIVGGVVGTLGGPVGILLGGLLGGLFGSNSDEEDGAKVRRFNNS